MKLKNKKRRKIEINRYRKIIKGVGDHMGLRDSPYMESHSMGC